MVEKRERPPLEHQHQWCRNLHFIDYIAYILFLC
jgi:hypothetical protein